MKKLLFILTCLININTFAQYKEETLKVNIEFKYIKQLSKKEKIAFEIYKECCWEHETYMFQGYPAIVSEDLKDYVPIWYKKIPLEPIKNKFISNKKNTIYYIINRNYCKHRGNTPKIKPHKEYNVIVTGYTY